MMEGKRLCRLSRKRDLLVLVTNASGVLLRAALSKTCRQTHKHRSVITAARQHHTHGQAAPHQHRPRKAEGQQQRVKTGVQLELTHFLQAYYRFYPADTSFKTKFPGNPPHDRYWKHLISCHEAICLLNPRMQVKVKLTGDVLFLQYCTEKLSIYIPATPQKHVNIW